jgi:hypothetical protein
MNSSNTYRFRVKIVDREASQPTDAKVYLYHDSLAPFGVAHTLDLVGGNASSGWIFDKEVDLSNPNGWKYAFGAKDGVHPIFQAIGKPTEKQSVIVSAPLPTDLNQDGVVNILDISIVARAYSSIPGDPTWNETADLNKDRIINILDIAMIARDYGRTV